MRLPGLNDRGRDGHNIVVRNGLKLLWHEERYEDERQQGDALEPNARSERTPAALSFGKQCLSEYSSILYRRHNISPQVPLLEEWVRGGSIETPVPHNNFSTRSKGRDE